MPGRYGWVGGTGTALYVVPRTGLVTVLLTQVELGAPDSAAVLEAFWAAVAVPHPHGPCGETTARYVETHD